MTSTKYSASDFIPFPITKSLLAISETSKLLQIMPRVRIDNVMRRTHRYIVAMDLKHLTIQLGIIQELFDAFYQRARWCEDHLTEERVGARDVRSYGYILCVSKFGRNQQP